MSTHTIFYLRRSLVAAAMLTMMTTVAACPSDDAPSGTETDATTSLSSSTAATSTSWGTTNNTSSTTATVTETTAVAEESTSTSSGETADTVASSGSSTSFESESSGTTMVDLPRDPFQFREEAPSEYTQVDRAGMPGKAIVLIRDHARDNQGTPAGDITDTVMRMDMTQRVDQLLLGTELEGDGLADDLRALYFWPCESISAPDQQYHRSLQCGAQFLFEVVPDVLTLDMDEPPGYPNGRLLEDRVMDLLLAKALLNIVDERFWGVPQPDDPEDEEQEAHELDAFFDLGNGVSLNPDSNDVRFDDARFFRLANPHAR